MVGAAMFFGAWYGVATRYKGSRFGAHLAGLFAGSLFLLAYFAYVQNAG